MNRNLIIGIIVVAVLVGGGFLFMNMNSSAPATQSTTPEPTAMQESTPSGAMEGETTTPGAEDAMEAGAVKEITVSGSNFKFDPPTITVKKGDTVKITFKNTGGFHDFVIDEFNVKTKQTQGPSQEVVEFTADKIGSFEYYCSVGTHRAQGMKGTLTVQ